MRSKSTQEPVLVDIHGIAAMLLVSPRTARRLVRERGFPPPVRLRGCVRWWKRDVLEFTREMTGSGGPVATRNN